MRLLPDPMPATAAVEQTVPPHTPRLPFLGVTMLCGMALLFALRCGKAPLSAIMVAHILAKRLAHVSTSVTWPPGYESILFDLRLPRIALAALVGSALAAARTGAATVLLVTNEVGMGLHPMTALGRLFVDLAGRANQRVAAAADEVTLMVCGLPVKVKSLADTPQESALNT